MPDQGAKHSHSSGYGAHLQRRAGAFWGIRTSNFAKKMPINSKSKVFFSGGLAKSNEVRLLLAEKLNCEVVTHEYAQYVGAIGAAVIGNQKANKILM